MYGYGIQKTPYNEGWTDDLNFWFEDLEVATEDKVKDFLIFEAEMRGFKEGVSINRSQINGRLNAWSKLAEVITIDAATYPNENWFYDLENDVLEKHGFLIYEKGVWAEIVEPEIDWSVPGQLVENASNCVWEILHENTDGTLTGIIRIQNGMSICKLIKGIEKEGLKPYKGEPIILK